jgi:hypothetical protein
MAHTHAKRQSGAEILQELADWGANGTLAGRLEEQLFQQRRRLADAERSLLTRSTKKALEDQRIAGKKISGFIDKHADLKLGPRPNAEARIYPGTFCPVLVMDKSGDYVVRPMRYRLRHLQLRALTSTLGRRAVCHR